MAQSYSGVKKTVLVVDDVAVVLLRAKKALADVANVRYAKNRREAMDIIEEKDFPIDIDIFILDINLPDGSGMDLLDFIRGMEKYAATPVIMLTANVSRANIEAAAQKGATRFMAKPFEDNDILAAFNACFKQGARRVP